MGRNATYNILMYSHDTYGLGHIRRTMAIAAHLRSPRTNILILTGSPIAGRFTFPEQVDFVRIPGMIKKTNEEYRPLSVKMHPQHALNIRREIITATARTFRPNLFIVDKEPLGLKKEVLPTLEWLRRSLPATRTILGLRDIMDDAQTVREDWREKGVYDILNELYSEIWVYGIQEFYDPVEQYAIPDTVSRKMCFTGYIPRKVPDRKKVQQTRQELGLANGEKLVVVTTGGGGDGYTVMDTYLTMLESEPNGVPFRSALVTGPFMPKKQRDRIFKRADRLHVASCQFHRCMEEMLGAADLVVSMGGYNTVCEILSQGTVSLIIPRESPRKEQLIRAQVLHQRKMLDFIPWRCLSAQTLRAKVSELLQHPEPFTESISNFRLTGLDIMRERLCRFQSER